MAVPSPYKFYHEEELDTKRLMESYFSTSSDWQIIEEIIKFPLQHLRPLLASGAIKAETLIDFSAGPLLIHLLAVCDYTKSITLLETNDSCIRELEKWMNKEEDTFDWSRFLDMFEELEGDSEKWAEREETLRRRIKQIMKWNVNKKNPTDPVVLPKVDCVMSLHIVGGISSDREAYCRNVKNLASLLRPGGHLVLAGGFNTEFFVVAGHKYHNLKYDEDFLRKVINDAGLTIQRFETLESTLRSGLLKYSHVWFLCAQKVRED